MGKKTFLVVLVMLLALGVVMAAAPAHASDETVWHTDTQGNLIIHVARITEEPVYIPLHVAGQRMEILAVRADDNIVRLAFNTCQVCSGAPRAYFVTQGNGVVCQNCGNFFPTTQVGSAARGCNPMAVPGVEPAATGTITIPASVLAAHVRAFRNWKRGL